MECFLYRLTTSSCISHTRSRNIVTHAHTFNDYIYKGFGKFEQQSL